MLLQGGMQPQISMDTYSDKIRCSGVGVELVGRGGAVRQLHCLSCKLIAVAVVVVSNNSSSSITAPLSNF